MTGGTYIFLSVTSQKNPEEFLSKKQMIFPALNRAKKTGMKIRYYDYIFGVSKWIITSDQRFVSSTGTDKNFVDNFLHVVIYLALVANI